jgi:hypothetical protein
MLLVALPIIIGLFFLGGDLLLFIYQNPSFAEAAVALNVVAFTLIGTSFTQTRSAICLWQMVLSGLTCVK